MRSRSRNRTPFIIALVTFLLLVGSGYSASSQGIDVSKFQGVIDWRKVKASGKVKFAYIKATEGTSIQDPMYKRNIDSARAAGILVGSYHLYSKKTTAYQQFGNFKKVVQKSKQDLIPVLDIEERYGRDLYIARVDKILELMELEYGVKPLIYTSEKVYWEHFSSKKYKNYHIFIANYRRYPSTRFTLWQHSQTGRVKGISGDVDLNKFHKNHGLNEIKMPKKK
ncbi:MAG: glycosyl hydrolase family 25 [Bacteroidales bacterium]|nr:glycosyl hydrolase family 25 [Bacteroidales bacterium]